MMSTSQKSAAPGLATTEPSAPQGVRPLRRIWVFEDHECFRELLADFIGGLPGIESVRTGDDIEQLFAAVQAGEVDLVLLDLQLRGAGGFRVLEDLRQLSRPPAVMILSGQATAHSINLALRLGVVGYLQKTSPLEEIGLALEHIRQGGSYFGQGRAREIVESVVKELGGKDHLSLSLREVELISRLVHGSTVKEVAQDQGLSKFTIYKMRTQIMLKTNVRNQRELVDYALRNGLIDPAKVR